MRPLKLVFRMMAVCWKLFGFRKVLTVGPYILMPIFTHLTMALDRLFFPGLKKVSVTRPIFIIGAPRSGTTFFHRLLNQTDELVTFRMWELLVPSLTGRKLLGPVISLLYKLYYKDMADGSSLFDEGFHDTDENAVEEEELLFYPIFESQFIIAFTPLAFDDREYLDLVFPERQSMKRQRRNARYLRACLARHIHQTGRTQVVAKLPYSTLRLQSLLEEFPDAKFIYLLRSPLETMPSHLSLHRSFFKHRWGLETIPPAHLARYWQRRYAYNVALYQHFHQMETRGQVPQDRVMTIRYEQFRQDLWGTFQAFLTFTGLQLSDDLMTRVKAQAEQQSHYKPRHENHSLTDFGLSESQLKEDLAFVFDFDSFDSDDVGRAAPQSQENGPRLATETKYSTPP